MLERLHRWTAVVARWWDRYWFTPGSLRDLALVRIVLFGAQTAIFLAYPNARHRALATQIAQASSTAMDFRPVVALRVLMLPWGHWGRVRPDATLVTTMIVIAFVAGVLATVGLFARATMPLAALANLFLVAHWFSYGDYHHAEALMLIALCVVACSPAAEVWSLDAWRRRRRGIVAAPVSPLARWPLRLMQWIVALTYLSAAWSKLHYGGLRWFNGYTMMAHFLAVGAGWNQGLAARLATLPPSTHIVPSVLAFGFELTFVVAVLVPRAAWVYVLVGLAFHFSVYETMQIGFFPTMTVYVVFVESIRCYWPDALRWSPREATRALRAPMPPTGHRRPVGAGGPEANPRRRRLS